MAGPTPPEVVEAARAVAARSAPYRVDEPVAWVLAPHRRIQAALDRLGRHGDETSPTYLLRLTGMFTSRAKPPGPGKEIVAVVPEMFILVEASGPDAGSIRGAHSGGWPVDMPSIGEVHSFDF